MKDVIFISLIVVVAIFFFMLLSASVSINSYYKPSADDDFDEPEYDDDGIAL